MSWVLFTVAYLKELQRICLPIPVAARSKACFCGRSLAGIMGSNSAGGMDVCLLWVLRVVS